jgi:hypothetical protein
LGVKVGVNRCSSIVALTWDLASSVALQRAWAFISHYGNGWAVAKGSAIDGLESYLRKGNRAVRRGGL